MENLIITPTRSTPGVQLRPDVRLLELSGTSTAENIHEFYGPVNAWLEQYLAAVPGEHVLHFHLAYFNSSSLKAIYQLLEKAKQACALGAGSLRVRWYGEADDDLLVESTAMLSDLLQLPMEIVPEAADASASAA
jgi:hypothetical protein